MNVDVTFEGDNTVMMQQVGRCMARIDSRFTARKGVDVRGLALEAHTLHCTGSVKMM
jgi:hypothetical protein